MSRMRRSTLDSAQTPLPTATTKDTASLLKAPGIIKVPNQGKYGAVEGDKFVMWGTQRLDEGWKLHIPLPDCGSLNPPFEIIFTNGGTQCQLPALEYMCWTAEQRKGDKIVQVIGHCGYFDLFEWLQSNNVVHKFVPSLALFRAQEVKEGGQGRGKFLTIYTDGPEQMHKIISQADKCLRLMDSLGHFSRVKQDLANKQQEKAVGSLFLVRARYGAYTSDWVLKPGAIASDVDISKPEDYPASKLCILDDRKAGYKPDHIADPFGLNVGQAGKEQGWYNHPGSNVLGMDNFGRPTYEYNKASKKFDTKRLRRYQ